MTTLLHRFDRELRGACLALILVGLVLAVRVWRFEQAFAADYARKTQQIDELHRDVLQIVGYLNAHPSK
jgi:hypothetical protein